MPEEMEVPTEHLHESIHEQAEKESWILVVALSAALLAVLAAVSSLLAGHHANEALLEQVQAADQWAYYQSKAIKAAVLEGKMELLSALEKTPAPADEERVKQYHDQQKEIEEKAHEMERSSSEHLAVHNIFAKAVTLFQIAIAIAAISAIIRKRWLWVGSLIIGAGGLVFLLQGVL